MILVLKPHTSAEDNARVESLVKEQRIDTSHGSRQRNDHHRLCR